MPNLNQSFNWFIISSHPYHSSWHMLTSSFPKVDQVRTLHTRKNISSKPQTWKDGISTAPCLALTSSWQMKQVETLPIDTSRISVTLQILLLHSDGHSVTLLHSVSLRFTIIPDGKKKRRKMRKGVIPLLLMPFRDCFQLQFAQLDITAVESGNQDLQPHKRILLLALLNRNGQLAT